MKQNSVYAIIPARGGSKGLHRKCLCTVAGKPLLKRAIDTAKLSSVVSKVFVSTDDDEFAEKSISWGAEVPFLRPGSLATDNSSTIDAVIHFFTTLNDSLPDYILLIQPTTPLLNSSDIDGAFELLKSGVDAVTSVCESEVNPDWMRRLNADGCLEAVCQLDVPQHTARQKMPVTYRLNGGLYLCRSEIVMNQQTFLPKKTVPYVMSQERSIDIDNEFDLKLANKICEII